MTTKNKQNKNDKMEKSDFLDEVKESSYFQWLIDNRQSIPYVFIATIILIAVAFKFTSGKTSRAESNYLLAENYFMMLNRSIQEEAEPESTLTYLEKLKGITDSYPELHSLYDGMIAQLLIAMDKPGEAKEYVIRSLERTSRDNLYPFNKFSRNTLLIAEGAYDQALIESKSLKDTLLHDLKIPSSEESLNPNFFANLFAYNLLRIAMLEKEVGSSKSEQEAWDEWKKYASDTSNPVLTEAFLTINRQLKEGEYSLTDYILSREITTKSSL